MNGLATLGTIKKRLGGFDMPTSSPIENGLANIVSKVYNDGSLNDYINSEDQTNKLIAAQLPTFKSPESNTPVPSNVIKGLADIARKNNTMNNMDKVSRVAGYEGFVPHVYKDKFGYDTIGYGHKLTGDDFKQYGNKKLSQTEAMNLLKKEYDSHINSFYSLHPKLNNISSNAKIALEDMAYNMGPAFLSKFPKAKEALYSGDYKKAANQFLNSKYAKDVGQRAIDNVNLLLGS